MQPQLIHHVCIMWNIYLFEWLFMFVHVCDVEVKAWCRYNEHYSEGIGQFSCGSFPHTLCRGLTAFVSA